MIESSDDEDKKFVSQAVAFVIGHTRNGFVPLCAGVATLLKEQAILKAENEKLRKELLAEQAQNERNKQKESHIKVSKVLKGCICKNCSRNAKLNAVPLSVPLKNGERVVIFGELCGTVCYVGHVDGLLYSEIYIGLHLDEGVGDSNGTVGGKRYFYVPERFGLFVPLSHVCCIMN